MNEIIEIVKVVKVVKETEIDKKVLYEDNLSGSFNAETIPTDVEIASRSMLKERLAMKLEYVSVQAYSEHFRDIENLENVNWEIVAELVFAIDDLYEQVKEKEVQRNLKVYLTHDGAETCMAKIIGLGLPENEAKALFECFIAYFESLHLVGFNMVKKFLFDNRMGVEKVLDAALSAASYGRWYGRFEGVEGKYFTLYPYVGDRFITITRTYQKHHDPEKWVYDVVIDYTRRPTFFHTYPLQDPEFILDIPENEEEKESLFKNNHPVFDDEDDEEDEKYFGASTLAKLRETKVFDDED